MAGVRDNGYFTKGEVLALGSPLVREVELYRKIGSTQERARELAASGARPVAVISASQSGGKGRLGRAWGSPPGGLWMSFVLGSGLDARLASRLTLAAAVAVAKALRQLGVEAQIKWPNDLLVSGRKVCGILAESTVVRTPDGPRVAYVVLGVGLNANFDVEDLAGTPESAVTTLRRELGHDVEPLKLLGVLLWKLEVEVGRVEDGPRLLGDWRAMNCTLGRRVRVKRFGETLEGVARDVSEEGALILSTSTGPVELFEGDVEQLRPRKQTSPPVAPEPRHR